MDMERINENTIRVSIGNEDLEERGITFLDLLGNQKQIENFFYSILEEVDVDEQFQETDSVTFQVLPNRDGLELFISKNLPMDGSEDLTDLPDGLDNDGFTDFLKEHLAKNNDELSQEVDEEIDFIGNEPVNCFDMVFRLIDFEAMITLAKNIHLHNVVTNVYIFKEEYYLHVTFFLDESTEEQMKNDVSRLYEYSYKTNTTLDILQEYGEMIMEQSALETTRYYFK